MMGYAKSSHQTIFKANGGQEVFYSEVRKAGGQANLEGKKVGRYEGRLFILKKLIF